MLPMFAFASRRVGEDATSCEMIPSGAATVAPLTLQITVRMRLRRVEWRTRPWPLLEPRGGLLPIAAPDSKEHAQKPFGLGNSSAAVGVKGEEKGITRRDSREECLRTRLSLYEEEE